MTYLPQLRSSLVRAAEQRYGEAPELQKRRRTRLALTTGGLATACAAIVAVAVAAIALIALSNHRTSTRPASGPVVTKTTLRHEAAEALARLVLPPGAVVSGLVRGTPAELWSPSSRLAIADHVDVYRVWRLHESPNRVIAFMEAHRPPSSSLGFGTEGASRGSNGGVVIQSATTTIGFPVTRRGIWRQLVIDVVSLAAGGSAIRVDSEAGWLMPRPTSQLIPPGVTRIQLAWTLRTKARHVSVVVAMPRRVRALVSLFNSLPSTPSGAGLCKHAPDGLVTFTFEAGKGTAPVAVATWAPPCQNLGLAIGGHPSVPLMANSPTMPGAVGVVEALVRLLPPQRVSGRSSATGTSIARYSTHTAAQH